MSDANWALAYLHACGIELLSVFLEQKPHTATEMFSHCCLFVFLSITKPQKNEQEAE